MPELRHDAAQTKAITQHHKWDMNKNIPGISAMCLLPSTYHITYAMNAQSCAVSFHSDLCYNTSEDMIVSIKGL